jgi:uncharacterized protein
MGGGAAAVKQEAQVAQDVGEFTFRDILQELEKPGRDPREEFVPFQYREDIHELKDLKPGMTCPGIVTNVTNFGAFVDIGVHQDGLVHLSQLANRFVKDPREVVSPGDRVQVRVLEINLEKSQISLSMKSERPPQAPRPPRPARAPRQAGTGASARPPQGGGRGRPASAGGGQGGKPSRPSRPPRPTFSNNPFAALAALKSQLPTGGKKR